MAGEGRGLPTDRLAVTAPIRPQAIHAPRLAYRPKLDSIRGVAVLLVLFVVGTPTPPSEPVVAPDLRLITMFGGSPGDGRESLERSVAAGVTDVEVNFVATLDGELVTGHQPEIGGDCGDVSLRTLAELDGCRNGHGEHIATLAEVLAMPFAGVWVDLKADAVQSALDVIGDRPGVTLMVYEPSFDALVAAGPTDAALGLKGYPDTADEIRTLIDRAAGIGVTLVCIEARWLTTGHLRYARDRGIAVLPWVGQDTDPVLLRELVRAGVPGLIVSGVTDLGPVYAPA